MTRALVAPLACVVCVTAACSVPLMKLPTGAGVPAADAADALAQATSACRRTRTLTAEVSVSGSAAGRRFRARMLVGVAAPASVRLEALAPFGPPVFFFIANNDDATLLLPRDDRVLEHGKPDEVLDAVAGVPLGAADLYLTLTGCAPMLPLASGRELGADWRIVYRGGRCRVRPLPASRRGDPAVAARRDDARGIARDLVARRVSRLPERSSTFDSDRRARRIRSSRESDLRFDARAVAARGERRARCRCVPRRDSTIGGSDHP